MSDLTATVALLIGAVASWVGYVAWDSRRSMRGKPRLARRPHKDHTVEGIARGVYNFGPGRGHSWWWWRRGKK